MARDHQRQSATNASNASDRVGGSSASESQSAEARWDERYRSAPAIWSGDPNPHLVAAITDVDPGRALDVGAGEGADAIWLAERGWTVMAVDISSIAIGRGRSEADRRGSDVAGRIRWEHADVTTWDVPVEAFDLVSIQFMHLPTAARVPLYRACVDAVASGGTIVVVGHHRSDLETSVRRPPLPDLYFDEGEITEMLGDDWTVSVAEARAREGIGSDGATVTVHDAVVVARRDR